GIAGSAQVARSRTAGVNPQDLGLRRAGATHDVEGDVLVVPAVVRVDLRATLLGGIPDHADAWAPLIVEGDAGDPVRTLKCQRVPAKANVQGDLVHDAPVALDEEAEDVRLGRRASARGVDDRIDVGLIPEPPGVEPQGLARDVAVRRTTGVRERVGV